MIWRICQPGIPLMQNWIGIQVILLSRWALNYIKTKCVEKIYSTVKGTGMV